MFTLTNKATTGKATKGSKTPPTKTLLYVTPGIVAQVFPHGESGECHPNQIQVTIAGNVDKEFRGEVTLTLKDGKKVTLYKGDTHALWLSHQVEEGPISELFLALVNGKITKDRPMQITIEYAPQEAATPATVTAPATDLLDGELEG